MKNLLLLALLAVATIGAHAAPSQAPTQSRHERKAARKTARQAKAPEEYKGGVAEQRRLVTEAAGAEGDRDTGDKPSKSKKSKDKE